MYDHSVIPPLDQWEDKTSESIGTGAPLKTFTRQVEEFGSVVYALRRSERTLKWHPSVTVEGKKTFRGLKGYPTEEEAYDALMRRCHFVR